MVVSVPVVAAASIDQRFAQLIQQFGLTKNSFAISLGKTASVVQHLIDGRNKPGFDLMCKVFEVYPNVSRDWLLLGRGPMLIGSNGSAAQPVAPPAPTGPEPDFEPIDLADVAPRAVRRATGNRLHPEEIAATLALASVAVNGTLGATTSVPAPDAPITPAPVVPENGDTLLPQSPSSLPNLSEQKAEAPVRQSVRPFRPAPNSPQDSASGAVAPITTPAPQIASVAAAPSPIPTAPLQNAVPATQPAPANSPEAYVAAAINAQHLQHQLALAELRNQHLLEQQQMLREMLAMARQSMV